MAELTAKIVTSQMETAVNLEQLRYLVIRGVDGKSAYEVAVSLGFEGTEQEWLDSLVGPQGPEGKNYGYQIDTDTETDGIIIQDPEMTVVKTVNGQSGAVTITADSLGAAKAASYAGANYPPMDDATANELLDCVYSYIDNADKLFYSGMNANEIAECTNFDTVQTKITNESSTYVQKLDPAFKAAVASASSLEEIRTLAANMAGEGDGDEGYPKGIRHYRLARALGVKGRWLMNTDEVTENGITSEKYINAKTACDYLLSGRKPMHCAWFAYLVSSGIRYETSLHAGNEVYSRYYDWGFDWPGTEEAFGADGQPISNLMADYCTDKGYGFTPSADFHELRTGDLMFFDIGSTGTISHVGVFLYHNADGQKCTIVDVNSAAPDGENTTYPIEVKTFAYDCKTMLECITVARLPYTSSGRVSQPKNLFSNEASYRDLQETLPTSPAVFAEGSFSEPLTLNRFYTFAICLDRASGIGDEIRLKGSEGASSNAVISKEIDAVPDNRADGVYCMTLFNGRYRKTITRVDGEEVVLSPGYGAYQMLNGPGIKFMSFTAQEATVKWIACYEGIHHVGRSGFIPYDNTLDLAAALATLPAPTITEQPENASITAEESAAFTVSAAGYGLKYLWQYKESQGAAWNNCSAATTGYNTDTLTVAGTRSGGTRNGYQYRCGIVDANGKTTFSEAATLTVEVS